MFFYTGAYRICQTRSLTKVLKNARTHCPNYVIQVLLFRDTPLTANYQLQSALLYALNSQSYSLAQLLLACEMGGIESFDFILPTSSALMNSIRWLNLILRGRLCQPHTSAALLGYAVGVISVAKSFSVLRPSRSFASL